MGSNVKATSGPILAKPADLAGMLTNLEKGDILFIDEIHRIQKSVEEYLYSAMEDFAIDIVLDQGVNARSVRLNIPKFTLVGATTRAGLLSAPMRSRFGMTNRLDYYSQTDLAHIVTRSASILGVDLLPDGALEIAARSRGTPRIANNLLRWVRDYAQIRADNRITAQVADAALSMLDVDKNGLDEMDKRILATILQKFGGGPVGISTIAVAIGEDAGTLEEVYEPYLIQQGYLARTPQGRVTTAKALRLFPGSRGVDSDNQIRLDI
jgi:Holliday junction DNA helicase RuvB